VWTEAIKVKEENWPNSKNTFAPLVLIRTFIAIDSHNSEEEQHQSMEDLDPRLRWKDGGRMGVSV